MIASIILYKYKKTIVIFYKLYIILQIYIYLKKTIIYPIIIRIFIYKQSKNLKYYSTVNIYKFEYEYHIFYIDLFYF